MQGVIEGWHSVVIGLDAELIQNVIKRSKRYRYESTEKKQEMENIYHSLNKRNYLEYHSLAKPCLLQLAHQIYPADLA